MIYDKNADGSPDPKKGEMGRFEFSKFELGPEKENFKLTLGNVVKESLVNLRMDENSVNKNIKDQMNLRRFQTTDRQVEVRVRFLSQTIALQNGHFGARYICSLALLTLLTCSAALHFAMLHSWDHLIRVTERPV